MEKQNNPNLIALRAFCKAGVEVSLEFINSGVSEKDYIEIREYDFEA